jgi:hypothetical protein
MAEIIIMLIVYGVAFLFLSAQHKNKVTKIEIRIRAIRLQEKYLLLKRLSR